MTDQGIFYFLQIELDQLAVFNWTGRLYTDIFKWDALDKTIIDLKRINSKHHEATLLSISNLKREFIYLL